MAPEEASPTHAVYSTQGTTHQPATTLCTLLFDSQPGPCSSVGDSLPGAVLAVEVACQIGCHPGLGCVGGQGGVWPVGRRRTSARRPSLAQIASPPGRPCAAAGPLPRNKSGLQSWLAVLSCRAGQGPHCLSRPACVGRAHRRLDEGNPSLFTGGRNQGLDNRIIISSGLCTPPSRSPPLPLRCCNAAQSELWTGDVGLERIRAQSREESSSRQSLCVGVHVPVGWASVAFFRWPACERPTDSQGRPESTQRQDRDPDETRPDRPKTCTRWLQGGSCKRGVARPTLPSSSSSNSSSLPTTYIHTYIHTRIHRHIHTHIHGLPRHIRIHTSATAVVSITPAQSCVPAGLDLVAARPG